MRAAAILNFCRSSAKLRCMMAQQAELTLLAEARFGMGAEMRPRRLALVRERLAEAGVTLVD